MEHSEIFFYTVVLALGFLLFISSLAAIFIKRLYLPYTVILVIIGIALSVLSQWSPFSFINALELSPDLVFYIFLPMLIFEGAYNIRFLDLVSSLKTISVLSIVSLVLSAFFIGGALFYVLPYLGMSIPFLTLLLFGSLISATDPIAALAIFRETGAPKRLRVLLEGESLLNDGTALIFFQVVMGVMGAGALTAGVLIAGFLQFWFLTIGGIIFGLAMGFLFAKIIERVHNLETVEITMTLILAHITFIFAERFIHVSGVISLVAAGMVMGNYGRYKVSPGVREFMEHFWQYAAFLANSLIFLLIGLSIRGVSFAEFAPPIIVALTVVLLARFFSVYAVVPFTNRFAREETVPFSWQFVLSWGGLRGALPLAIVLLLPFDFAHRNFLLILTLSIIFFTLLIQATTFKLLLRRFKLTAFSLIDRLEREEGFLMMDAEIQKRIKIIFDQKHISQKTYEKLSGMYTQLYNESKNRLSALFQENKKYLAYGDVLVVLRKHALSIERMAYIRLFDRHEISEYSLSVLNAKIERQIDRIERRAPQVRVKNGVNLPLEKRLVGIFYYVFKKFDYAPCRIICENIALSDAIHDYRVYRARKIAAVEVIGDLQEMMLQNEDDNYQKALVEIITQYKNWQVGNANKLEALKSVNPKLSDIVEYVIANMTSLGMEIDLLKDMYAKGIIPENVFNDVFQYYERLHLGKQNFLTQYKYYLKKGAV